MVPESQEDDVCTNVTINADSIIEFAELFQMTFNSPTIPLCNPSNQLSITIQDSTREFADPELKMGKFNILELY